MDNTRFNGPLVIGGVGGSGTRVIAEIAAIFGIYLGADLNRASDNLTYTLLFRRPRWFYKHRHDHNTIATGINLFRKLMLRDASLTARETAFLLRAMVSVACFGHIWKGKGKGETQGNGKGFWPIERMQRLLSDRNQISSDFKGWGWKEPNSHLLIEDLAAQFPKFKYVHTIRNGLDMAFSRNQLQLYNWGPMFGVPRPESPSAEPSASLKYWIAANDRVLKHFEVLGPDRVLIINFDDLCRAPDPEIHRLLRFLNVESEDSAFQQALRLPRTPATTGRYRSEDLTQFDEDDLASLPRFGFTFT